MKSSWGDLGCINASPIFNGIIPRFNSHLTSLMCHQVALALHSYFRELCTGQRRRYYQKSKLIYHFPKEKILH